MAQRTREQVGVRGARCGICGAEGVAVIESRRVRRGLAVLNPRWDPRVRTYELCGSCGAKRLLEDDEEI
jgi:hypothetical protein